MNIIEKVDSTGTSNPSPVYENCEIRSEEIYENILQDSIKTNSKGKNIKAMHGKFKSSTPCKPAQIVLKKRKLHKTWYRQHGMVLYLQLYIMYCVKVLMNQLRSLGYVIKSSEVYRSQEILMTVTVSKKQIC